MKNIRILCGAVTLASVLTLPTSAGIMDTPVAPPQNSVATSSVTDGEMDTPTATDAESSESDPTDSFTEAALKLIESVLSLF